MKVWFKTLKESLVADFLVDVERAINESDT